MATYIDTIRAISSVIAKRAIVTAGVFAAIIAGVFFAVIWSLAHYLSAWWWLLLLIFIPLLFVSFIVFGIALWLQRRIYSRVLNSEQRSAVKKFSDKITRLIEARGLGWWMFAFTSVRELIQYKEMRTLKSVINDSSTVKSDFEQLKNLL